MKSTITSEEAKKILQKYLKTLHLLAHSRETEVIMKALAKQLNEDEELWGCTGLLHDLDLDEIGKDYSQHGERTCDMILDEGYDIPEMFQAIKSHTENLGYLLVDRKFKLDYALAAAENTSGLIYAYAIMRPEKKIAGAKVKSLTKKFKDKSFAAKIDRDLINDIEKTGIERSKFFEIALTAMEEIAEEIGI